MLIGLNTFIRILQVLCSLIKSSFVKARARTVQRRLQPAPYSFRHQMSLTRDVERFREGVRSAPLAGNIDSPESGLDALMQVRSVLRMLRVVRLGDQ